MPTEQPLPRGARAPAPASRRVAGLVILVGLGLLGGVLLTYLLAPDGIAQRLPGGADADAARPFEVKTLVVAGLLAAGMALHYWRWDRSGFGLVLVAGLAAALHWPPGGPSVTPNATRPVAQQAAPVITRPATPPLELADATAPQHPPALPPATRVAAPNFVPRAPASHRTPGLAPAGAGDPAVLSAVTETPAPPPRFSLPPGCTLYPPVGAAGTAPDLTSTCGFVAPNGNTRLLELRRRILPRAEDANARSETEALLASDEPQPVVVQLSGYTIVSYEAAALDAAGRPEGFETCIRADELRGETREGQGEGQGEGLSWSERRYICRSAAASPGQTVEVALYLREGHRPDDLSEDFAETADSLVAILTELRGDAAPTP